MDKTAILLLISAGDCLAHPGHGAPLIHTHGWDWANVWFWIGVAVVAAVAAWRAKLASDSARSRLLEKR